MVKRRTLTQEKVIEHANQLIATHGLDHLTIRELATDLGVRPQSIYNYARSLNDLLDQVGVRFVHELAQQLLHELAGVSGDTALMVFAQVFRRACQRQVHLAPILLTPNQLAELPQTHAALVALYREMFTSLHLLEHAGTAQMAAITLYRSALFGFIMQELGGFLRLPPEQVDERFTQTMTLAIRQLPVRG